MKKLLSIITVGLLIILLFFVFKPSNPKPFNLDEKYYHSGQLLELDNHGIIELEKKESSFIVFVYQHYCSTSNDLNSFVNELVDKHQITFYKTTFESIQDTQMERKIKYCPSLVIYRNGQLMTYLDANSDKHTKYYQSTSELENWLTNYINLEP